MQVCTSSLPVTFHLSVNVYMERYNDSLNISPKCRFSTSCQIEYSLNKYSECKGSAKFLMHPSEVSPGNEKKKKRKKRTKNLNSIMIIF